LIIHFSLPRTCSSQDQGQDQRIKRKPKAKDACYVYLSVIGSQQLTHDTANKQTATYDIIGHKHYKTNWVKILNF